MPFALVAHLLWTQATVAPRVTAAPPCPDASAIAEATQKLSFPADARNHTAAIEETEGKLQLTLRDEGNRVLGTKLLEDQGASCADLADAVALVLLLWESEPPTPALPSPELPAPPTETAAVRSVTPPNAAVESSPAAPSKKPKERIHLAIGAGPLGSVTSDGTTFAGVLYGVLESPSRRYGLDVTLSGETNRTLPLSQGGSVDWSRFAVATGLLQRWFFGRFTATAQADITLDVLEAQAHGLALNETVLAVEDPGARLGGRLDFGLGNTRFWLGVSGTAWPVPVTLRPSNLPNDTATLPNLELWFGLGLEEALF